MYLNELRREELIQLGLSVGLRVSEVVSVPTGEVEFERGFIKI